ncbi:hypothetical protein KY308_00420 [Candidatus Woesearchaeota archaeon]|nr:hypothetical protein [Candidatus Woesearchaeota archaeon]
MNKKALVILLLAVLIITPFLAHSAFSITQQEWESSPLGTVVKLFVDNFGFLLTDQFANELKNKDTAALVYIKILLALLIIFPLFMVLKMMVGDKHRATAGVVAVVIAIISIILIPGEILLMLLETYKTAAIVGLFALPIGAIVLFYRFLHSTIEKKSRILGALVEIGGMILGLAFTQQFTAVIRQLESQSSVMRQVISLQWIALLYGIFAVGLLFAIFKLVTYFRTHPEMTLGMRVFGKKGPEMTGGGTSQGIQSLKDITQPLTAEEAQIRGAISAFENSFGQARELLQGTAEDLDSLQQLDLRLADAFDNLNTLAQYAEDPRVIERRSQVVSEINNIFEALKRKADAVSKERRKSFDDLNSRFAGEVTNIKKRISTQRDLVIIAKNKAKSVKQERKQSQVEGQMGVKLDELIEHLDAEVRRNVSNFENVESSVNKLRDDTTALQNRIGSEIITNIQNALNSAKGENPNFAETSQGLRNVSGNIDNIKNQIAQITAEETAIAEQMQNFINEQNVITSIIANINKMLGEAPPV